jgi:Putative zinc-finger
MTELTCMAVRQRLAAFHDDELPLQLRIAVQSHVNLCDECLAQLQERYQAVGTALRLAAAPGPADDWTGLTPGVISRMRAEANQTWMARLARTFDDMHLVWIGLAATVGTVFCGVVVLGVLHFASPERGDSLRAMITVISAPSGSNLNPASLDELLMSPTQITVPRPIQAPTVPRDGIVRASLERSGAEGEMMAAFSAVISREGNISGVELLGDNGRQRQVQQLIQEISSGRLEPARYGTDPVAVTCVWLVEHMTVKAKQRG